MIEEVNLGVGGMSWDIIVKCCRSSCGLWCRLVE